MLVSNSDIFAEIAESAFDEMLSVEKTSKRLNPSGEGYILEFDPTYQCFKSALTCVVFTAIWLESLLHLAIVEKHGRTAAREYDRKSYQDKLKCLGINDNVILHKAERLRRARREIVHEKAHFDKGKLLIAQSEAANAHELFLSVHELLRESYA